MWQAARGSLLVARCKLQVILATLPRPKIKGNLQRTEARITRTDKPEMKQDSTVGNGESESRRMTAAFTAKWVSWACWGMGMRIG